MRKIHCSTRKNTIRNNHFIHELTPRTSPEITNLLKNLLVGLEFIIWLCVLSSLDKLLASINCCKTHHQPNSFTHSLTNLLYWAYWAHILFYLGLGYDLWPYKFGDTKFFTIFFITAVLMLLMIIILFLFYFMTIFFYYQANTLIGFINLFLL